MDERITREERKLLHEMFGTNSHRYLGDGLPELEAWRAGELFVAFLVYPSGCGHYGLYSGEWERRHEAYLVSADFKRKQRVGAFSLKYTTEWPFSGVQTMFEESIEEVHVDEKKLCIVISQRWFDKEDVVFTQGGTGVRTSTWRASREPVKTASRKEFFEI